MRPEAFFEGWGNINYIFLGRKIGWSCLDGEGKRKDGLSVFWGNFLIYYSKREEEYVCMIYREISATIFHLGYFARLGEGLHGDEYDWIRDFAGRLGDMMGMMFR